MGRQTVQTKRAGEKPNLPNQKPRKRQPSKRENFKTITALLYQTHKNLRCLVGHLNFYLGGYIEVI